MNIPVTPADAERAARTVVLCGAPPAVDDGVADLLQSVLRIHPVHKRRLTAQRVAVELPRLHDARALLSCSGRDVLCMDGFNPMSVQHATGFIGTADNDACSARLQRKVAPAAPLAFAADGFAIPPPLPPRPVRSVSPPPKAAQTVLSPPLSPPRAARRVEPVNPLAVGLAPAGKGEGSPDTEVSDSASASPPPQVDVVQEPTKVDAREEEAPAQQPEMKRRWDEGQGDEEGAKRRKVAAEEPTAAPAPAAPMLDLAALRKRLGQHLGGGQETKLEEETEEEKAKAAQERKRQSDLMRIEQEEKLAKLNAKRKLQAKQREEEKAKKALLKKQKAEEKQVHRDYLKYSEDHAAKRKRGRLVHAPWDAAGEKDFLVLLKVLLPADPAGVLAKVKPRHALHREFTAALCTYYSNLEALSTPKDLDHLLIISDILKLGGVFAEGVIDKMSDILESCFLTAKGTVVKDFRDMLKSTWKGLLSTDIYDSLRALMTRIEDAVLDREKEAQRQKEEEERAKAEEARRRQQQQQQQQWHHPQHHHQHQQYHEQPHHNHGYDDHHHHGRQGYSQQNTYMGGKGVHQHQSQHQHTHQRLHQQYDSYGSGGGGGAGSWEAPPPRPTPLVASQPRAPAGYSTAVDSASGRTYYVNAADGSTSWDCPQPQY